MNTEQSQHGQQSQHERHERDLVHLHDAVELARRGMEERAGGPFGAVIVDADDNVVARGWNRVTSTSDPTAHAEVVAIRRAARAMQSFELDGTTIYASGEPCPMCWAACRWARVDRIVYANTRQAAAEIGFDDQFLYDELATTADRQSVPMHHLPLQAAADVYDRWMSEPSFTRY